jgi:hypothetical protein
MALNVHRVFENGSSYGSYHSAIAVSDTQEAVLRDARDKIRDAIRTGLRLWETLVEKSVLFDQAFAGIEPPRLRPKFRMQGSFSYRTQIEPAHLPPQQMDLDDGLFLPVSYISQGRDNRPVVASLGLFQAVEKALEPLCRREGWGLIKDKDSCVRVEISDVAHVDVALYALPDAQFAQLVEKVAGNATIRDSIRESMEFDDALYRELRDDALMLAHRKEGWKPSDPRKLDDWFQGAVAIHGYQVRRTAKYLKGWRDFQWVETCRLSSIVLMAAVVDAYNTHSREFDESRDDLALLNVARHLPGFLAGRIPNPVVPGQYLDEGWSTENRNEYVAAASELSNAAYRAISRSATAGEALRTLTSAFGDRIPTAEELVEVDGFSAGLAAPTVHRAAEVREAAAAAAINQVRGSGAATKPWAHE